MSVLAEVDENYFLYLRNMLLGENDDRAITHQIVLREMAFQEFLVRHPFDENRIYSVQSRLRSLYFDDVIGPATVLEVLISISQSFEWDVGSDLFGLDWKSIFWEAVKNLGLLAYPDDEIQKNPNDSMNAIRTILMNWLERRYDYHGRGGCWPLVDPKDDARQNDLWRQISLYYSEHYAFDS